MALALKPRWSALALWGGVAILVTLRPPPSLHTPQPPQFPMGSLALSAMAAGLLVISVLGVAAWGGPQLARQRWLVLLETPPELFWGGGLIALWPAAWGPPGYGALTLAFLLALGPTEVRWLCSALPQETPFPAAWGEAAQRRSRRLALRQLMGRWIALRLPLWITGTLILESLLGVPGLGLDWSNRFARHDTVGLLVWLAAFATLHLLAPDAEEGRAA